MVKPWPVAECLFVGTNHTSQASVLVVDYDVQRENIIATMVSSTWVLMVPACRPQQQSFINRLMGRRLVYSVLILLRLQAIGESGLEITRIRKLPVNSVLLK